MRVLSVTEVHGGSGVELAGSEELVHCEIPVSRGHRPHQRVLHRGLRRRTLLYYFQTGVEVRVVGFEFRETLFEAPDEVFVGLGRDRADVKRDVGARWDDV